MSKQYVGKNVAALDKSPALLPYSKVVIIVGEDEETGEQLIYTAGDDTGRTLEINNPWGTAQMANDILSRISGYAYKPFSADQALVPDDADVGDAVSICGIYGMIVKQEVTFDPNGSSSISAPEGDETENEFGIINSRSASERALARKINHLNTRFTVDLGKIETEISDTASGLSSRITQTADAITSEVSRATGVEGNLSTRITQTADAITSEVSRAKEAESTISQKADSITLSVTSSNGSSTFTLSNNETTLSTETLNLTVTSANIKGTLTIGQLPSTVATTSDVTTIVGNVINTGYVNGQEIAARVLRGNNIDIIGWTGETVTGTITTTMGSSAFYVLDISSVGALRLKAKYGDCYISATGGYVTLNSDTGITVTTHFYPSANARYTLGAATQKWTDVYATNGTIQTSDREAKKNISYGLKRFDKFFDELNPCTYQFKDGHDRTHFGLIAQDIEELIDRCGFTTKDIAAFIKSDNTELETKEQQPYLYALRYTEFIPLMIWEIQQLKAKIKELTNHE